MAVVCPVKQAVTNLHCTNNYIVLLFRSGRVVDALLKSSHGYKERKKGDHMASNGGRLLELYDELSSFFTQLNL